KIKIPFEYTSIQEAGENSVILLKDNKYELFSIEGKALSKISFNNLEKVDSNRILAKSDQWGIIDNTGKEIMPFEYGSIYQKSTQLLALSKQGRTAIMNREFKLILPYTFGYIGRMIGDYFVAQNGNYYGFYHQSGKEIFPWVYHEINYNENLSILLLRKDSKWALADTSGKLLSSFIFDEIRMAKKPNQYNEQIIAIRINKLWGFLSKTGKLILTPQFESISSWNNESFIVRNNKHFGFYNAEGDKIFDTIYDDIKFIHEQLLAIKINGKYSFGEINSNKILFEPRFDEVSNFAEDLIAVSINTKWGFATKKGGLAIPCIYNQAQAFHEGRACVKVFDKWGFIDKTG
ncbi:MAG: WG repeat-containing protein, partial [Bacteroidia bacterium]